MNPTDRAQRRWLRFPIDVAFTAEAGEDVEKTLLSADEFEFAAANGPLESAWYDTVAQRSRRPEPE